MGKIKINAELLPIKAHYFCFMAAMGPILPQLSVFGKSLGVSPAVMGSVTAILPIAFMVAKPIFGLIVDIFRDYRKTIFMGLIVVMSSSFALFYVIPSRELQHYSFNSSCDQLDTCNVAETTHLPCESYISLLCTSKSVQFQVQEVPVIFFKNSSDGQICVPGNTTALCRNSRMNHFECVEDVITPDTCLYQTWKFWVFIAALSIGSIAFNVVNSVSDAVCFDVTDGKYDYGKQRVWGTVGFGITALLSGAAINTVSDSYVSYTPAFIIMLLFTAFDLFSCAKLKLPADNAPENIFKDLRRLFNNRHTIVFLSYAVFAGILDGFIVYFLFWYLEDLAFQTETTSVKLLEGLIVAAETLGGEVIFFSISGKILERFGHAHCFSMCFINYALRLGLISVVPSPWWILPIEFLMQGPTYALTYTTIVAYANAIAPPGASATMQGIAAGMDDGFGYAIGSLVGGLLYKLIGGRGTLQILSAFALICSISHLCLNKVFLHRHKAPNRPEKEEYKTPAEAALAVYDTSTVSDIHCL